MKLAKGLRDAIRCHPFEPEEGGIYAVLDESGNVVPAHPWETAEFKTPNIACDRIGYWTVLTTFEEALYLDEPAHQLWFETCVYGDECSEDTEKLKAIAGQPHIVAFETLATLHAPTLKKALRNHVCGIRLAKKNPRT